MWFPQFIKVMDLDSILAIKNFVKSQSTHAEKSFAGQWPAKGFDKFFDLQNFLTMVVLLLLLYENALWISSTEGMLPKMPLRPFIMERNFVMNNDIDFLVT